MTANEAITVTVVNLLGVTWQENLSAVDDEFKRRVNQIINNHGDIDLIYIPDAHGGVQKEIYSA